MPTSEIAGQKHILAPLCEQWLQKIKDAKKVKWERFGQYAVEGMKFYDSAHDWMWKEEYARGQGGFLEKDAGTSLPTFRMQVNRLFEVVALFGPAMYHRNPDVLITPVRRPQIAPEQLGMNMQDPRAMQLLEQIMSQEQMSTGQRATTGQILQHYVNWLQVEADKKTHARRSITEAIVKGMGVLWTEIYSQRGSKTKFPWSYHISVDDIVIDPDAEYWEDVQWIARYCCHPVNLVEDAYGLPQRTLKGHMQSLGAQADTYGSKRETSQRKKFGRSFDLIEYWKVYSKNGFGDKLRKTGDRTFKSKFDFEPFGDFCRIVVADNIPFPLNLPTSAIEQEELEQLFERVQWETPFWESGGWPASFLSFYDRPRCVWPISMVKPAIGELRFVNWCMSFLADKVASACTTYVAVAKQAGMEIQTQLKNGLAPYTVLEISQLTGRSINDCVTFLDSPNFSADIWKMLSEVLTLIDKRMGTVDLIYGMTDQQVRSATEANIKEQNTNIRPDDMASRVEDFLSETAVNEIAAAVWHCEGQDVQPCLGDSGALFWDQYIKTQSFDRIIHDYDYRVAAGSARKPNKTSKQRALAELGQVILPTIQGYAMQGVVEPWNAYISETCQVLDIDPAGFLLAPKEQEGPDPEEQMMQLEMQKLQLEMQAKQQELQLKLQQSQQEAAIKQQSAQQQAMIQQESMQTAAWLKQQAANAELEQQRVESELEMDHEREMNSQELLMERARLSMLTKENELKLQGLKAMQAAKVAAARAQARVTAENKGSSENG